MAIQSLDLQCEHCHTEEHYKIGHNDNEDSIEKAINNFQGKTQIQIRSIIRKHRINDAEYGFSLFSCPECHTLFNPYAVEIDYDEIMLFKPFHKCGPCNSTLIRATDPVESYACRQCGKTSLHKK